MSDSASTLSGRDWDVVPQDKWNIDMCIRWLRDEVKWSEDDKKLAREWLGKYSYPGRHVTVTEVMKNLPHISVDAIDEFDIALERLKPPGNTQEISPFLFLIPL